MGWGGGVCGWGGWENNSPPTCRVVIKRDPLGQPERAATHGSSATDTIKHEFTSSTALASTHAVQLMSGQGSAAKAPLHGLSTHALHCVGSVDAGVA